MRVTTKAAPNFKGLHPRSARTSATGRANRARDTRPERLLRQALWRLGVRYRVHIIGLPGRPDIVFVRARIAVFCDGDFWHGRDWSVRRQKLSSGHNANYWVAKIERNMERDQAVNAKLELEGWRPIRIWESDILKNTQSVAIRVAELVRERST